MKPLLYPIIALSLAILPQVVKAELRSLIGGNDPYEVQEKAYKLGFQYPVGPMKCGQRCSQWWGRESLDSER